MTNKAAAELARGAAKRIKGHWAKRVFVDRFGLDRRPLKKALHDHGVMEDHLCMCLIGAVIVEACSRDESLFLADALTAPVVDDVIAAVTVCIMGDPPERHPEDDHSEDIWTDIIFDFNDGIAATEDEVIEKLECAARRLEGGADAPAPHVT